MSERDPHDVVRLTTAANPVEAHMIEQALEAEGIACKVVGDYLDAGIGDIPGVRAEVWVHQDDVAAAEAVLKTFPESRQATEEHEPEA
jgi:Putative prokaryotic signal transducing protein